MKSIPRKTLLTHLGSLVAWTSFGIVIAALVLLVGVPLVMLWIWEMFWGLRPPKPAQPIIDGEMRGERIAAFLAVYEWLQDHDIDDVDVARQKLKQFTFQLDDV